VKERGLIPFIDMAYQGFDEGIDADAYAVRAMADAGVQCFVANSFSKNFSLYGERCGGLSVVCTDRTAADTVLGQLKAAVRRNYSNPPTHGARLIAQVLTTPELRSLWEQELTAMRARIRDMRISLHRILHAHFKGTRNVDLYLTQRGMFSYTGLSEQQVNRLRDEHAVYLVRSGRMCMTGLSPKNVDAVAQAVIAVMA